jgi:hypothetical protein
MSTIIYEGTQWTVDQEYVEAKERGYTLELKHAYELRDGYLSLYLHLAMKKWVNLPDFHKAMLATRSFMKKPPTIKLCEKSYIRALEMRISSLERARDCAALKAQAIAAGKTEFVHNGLTYKMRENFRWMNIVPTNDPDTVFWRS